MGARYDYDLAVLGGGAAGLTVAAGAARLGVKVLLVEREGRLGGDCLHFGCVPSKTLIATARARRMMARAGEFGLPEVALPPVDFALVRRRIEAVIAAIQQHDSPERFRGLGAEVRFGEARFLDDHVLEIDGGRVSAARIVVATGSRAAVPDIPGLAEAGFLTNREIFSLERLPERLVILGGGPIAVEMGQAFFRLGSKVTLVQRSARILTREDADLATVVQARLAAEGLDLRLGAKVVSVTPGAPKTVTLERDGRREAVAATDILVAMGRAPNLEGLGLDAAGVVHTKKGLVLDARLRSSRSHIFGAGDVTGEHLFTHAAGYEGGVVVAGAVFRLPKKAEYRLLPRCVYAEPELAVVGATEDGARKAGLAVTTITEPFSGNDRARAEGETEGLVKIVLGDKGRPLGVGIVGPDAGELAGEWVAALAGKVGLGTLSGAVHPYPTLAETSKRAAGRGLEAKLFSPVVRRVLRLFFGYRGKR
ncbi:FAD-dependent pyridine nucleotide-disulfide oxidoreductase [Solidesulfovibrio fructosivorans JJ]]|uniref:FAD-dependent pyridine nucleotide-disulfide oxidoreductase n=1 Tax=Solidesulfovibrio fructosivorans JJ] TaxID=596151 RepID=E1K000_SOLFR|nr:FAD-dependent oxidoreductase [Solidesulfovibrio fructosivorans]EFL50095.1 FAD-dependent pyridine nucleotide-disulfide oxidoreductase [Solidesulfovibrio fructosivorans JJ]]